MPWGTTSNNEALTKNKSTNDTMPYLSCTLLCMHCDFFHIALGVCLTDDI